jgi:hypothetical protein
MPVKKVTIILFLLISLLISYSFPGLVFADVAVPACTQHEPTCDLCGWCGRCTVPAPATPVPSPFNWDKCFTCLYPTPNQYPNPADKKYYTMFGCVDTNAGFFVQKTLNIVFGIAGGLTFLSVIYGSVVVLTSKGEPLNIQNGKEIITSSLIGLLLIIFSVFLLKVVGVDILKIPGIG